MSRRTLWLWAVAATVAVVIAVVVSLRPGGDPADPCLRGLVPAYFTPAPGGHWERLISQAPADRATAILNPQNGPGADRDERFAQVVAEAQEQNVEVVGYVATGYGARPLTDVRKEIDAYRRWYRVGGIFVDEAARDAGKLSYYREVLSMVRAVAGQKAILNPGAVPDEGYMEVSDVIVTFEGPRTAYDTARFPGWTTRYEPERFAHLVHGAAGADPASVLETAAARHAGNVYVTDDGGANPWDTLASYFRAESRALADCVPAA